ncbi:MAG: hypothetical protein C0600_11050 [Ignavibacteria bacterium]|nr:MAG: hypothetical protein C0600_11050 [Ignavibacteria bacterium]
MIRVVVCAIVCFVLFVTPVAGQVQLSPHSLYLTKEFHSAEVTLTSSSNSAMTVELQVRAQDNSVSGELQYSCASWITVTPSRVELPPAGRAVVRIDLKSPGNEKEAEYHARLVCIEADAGSPDGGSPVAEPVAFYYRKGDVYSDVKLAGVSVERSDGEIHFLFTLEQLGNAAYRGNLALRIQNGKGKTILEKESTVDIYERGVVRESLPAERVPKGKYRIFLNFNSDRRDLGDRAIPVLPKKFTVDIGMS